MNKKVRTPATVDGEIKMFVYDPGKGSIHEALTDTLAEAERECCDQILVDTQQRLIAIARYRHFDEQNRYHRNRLMYTEYGLELYNTANAKVTGVTCESC